MTPSNMMDKKAREGLGFIHKYCRMCALELKQGVSIFGEEGKRLHIPEKIRRTLTILVLEEDMLPKRICTDCCSSLEDYAQYKNTVLDAQEKLACIAKSLSKSESLQRLHKRNNPASMDEDSVLSSSECLSDDSFHKEKHDRRKPSLKSPKKRLISVKCGVCGDIFTEESSLKSHHKESHSNLQHHSPIVQCASCPKISRKYKVIHYHYLRHHNNEDSFKSPQSHSCKDCGKRYHSHTELTIHVNSKHPIEEPDSPASFSSVISTPERLADDYDAPASNQSTGSGEQIPCYSGSSTSNQNPSNQTSTSNSGNVVAITSEPPESHRESQHDTRFNGHNKKYQEQNAKECNVSESNASPPSKSDEASSSKQIPEKVYKRCDICDKNLFTKAGYLNHMMIHEGRRFECQECNISYTQKSTLDTHMKIHHLNAPKKYACSVCNKKFIDFKALNRHQKIHSEPSLEFQCSFTDCKKKYKTATYLQRHLRRHTQPPKHLCPTCGKAFYQKRKLDDHMHTHSGKKTEGCPWCDKCFGTFSNYTKHVKKKHPSQIEEGKKIPPPRKVTSDKEDVDEDSDDQSSNNSPPVPQSAKPSTSQQITEHHHSPPPPHPPPTPVSHHNSSGSGQQPTHSNHHHSPIVVPIPQPQIQEAHQQHVTQQPPPPSQPIQEYHEPSSEPIHSSSYQMTHQSPWGQLPASSSSCGKNYQNPSGGNGNSASNSMNALDLVDCAIHHALGNEGNGNANNIPPTSQHNHHSSQQIHGSNPSVLSIVHHQSEPMELSYKLDSNPNSFQDMPMELTKVFQRDPLELCVRQDFSNPLMDLSSRVVESGNMGMISGITMNNMSMNGVCGMGMGMSNTYHKLDLTDRELLDMGAFRQPIDLISRADDGHQLCSEGNLVDLSLRSSFSQDQSASSFLRELIDLSARSDSFHTGELDLTKHTHQHHQSHHPSAGHHSQHQHHHSNTGGVKSSGSSLQHVVYQDAMFSLQN